MRNVRVVPLVIAATLAAGLARGADTVKLRVRGEKRQGKVLCDDAEKVQLQVQVGNTRATVEYTRDQVQEVVYDDERPREYYLGKAAFGAGRYEEALHYLQTAMDGPHHELLEQYILHYLAQAHIRLGETMEAKAALEKLRAQGKRTRFRLEVAELLAKMYAELGQYDDAARVASELKGPTQTDRARILLIRALIEEKQKQYDRALRLYERAAREVGTRDVELSAKAELGSVRSLTGLKRYDETVRRLRQIIRTARSDKTTAEAYVLLGDALQSRAKTPEDYEEALLAYLRVPALYGGDETTEAKALHEAARCYMHIPGAKSRARSDKLRQMLRMKYRNSPYVRGAR